MAACVALATALVAACVALGACSSAPKTANARFVEILGRQPAGIAAAVAHNELLTVANDAGNPPQSSIDPTTKQLVGFDVDVAKRVGEILGLQIDFINPNWDAVPAGLKRGTFDVAIGSIPITATRAESLSFSAPYAYGLAEIVVRQGSTKLTSAAQLKGKSIGAGVQTVYQLWLQKRQGVTVQIFSGDAAAYDALRDGKVAGVMTSEADAYAALGAEKSLELSGPALFYQPLGFAASPGEKDLVAVLNHAIDVMRKDGSLKAISEKWYGGHDITQPPPASVPRFDQ